MKSQRFRFKLTALLLVGLIVAAGAYGAKSVSQYGGRWFSFSANPRLTALKQRAVKGDILDRNGLLLASTVDGSRVYSSSAPVRRAMVHVLGDRQDNVLNGVETFHAGYLYGYSTSFTDALRHLLHPEEARRGNNVTLTVDAGLSSEVSAAFDSHPLTRGKRGAAVVLNYLTGEVLALVSLPNYDPDNITAETQTDPDAPFFNRAVQSRLPPGSTFKIVTAAAALSNLPDIRSRVFNCSGSLKVSDSYTVRDFKDTAHGRLTLDGAFLHSCNSVFASLALELGDSALRGQAEKFGFNQHFLFRDIVVDDPRYPGSGQNPEQLAASGFGQSSLTTSPMHLCLISAAVANGGVMPEPRLLKKVADSSGGTRLSFSAASAGTVCPRETAERLSAMMKSVVQDGGSGTRAAVTTLDVRGKTGTAVSTDKGRTVSYGWFTGFNAQKDLPVALCVLVEDIPDGETGGTTSALIAHDLFSWVKSHPETFSR